MGETRKPCAGFALSPLRTDRPVTGVDEGSLSTGNEMAFTSRQLLQP